MTYTHTRARARARERERERERERGSIEKKFEGQGHPIKFLPSISELSGHRSTLRLRCVMNETIAVAHQNCSRTIEELTQPNQRLDISLAKIAIFYLLQAQSKV